MGKVNLYNGSASAATTVPNAFIEKHMTHADGEYVKIYLYLLRCMNRADYEFSVARFAEHFDHTEKDILRALNYWENARLLRLEHDADGALCGICLLDSDAQTVAASGQTAAVRRTDYSPEELSHFAEKSEISELLFVAEQYLGRTLSPNDLEHIFTWYDQLHFSAEFIEFLIENCVSRGHTNIRYIEKVAEDFASRGIRTVAEAKEALAYSSELYSTVMKAFGIRGRNLGASERDYITKWSTQLCFPAELIGEACRRTIEQIHDPSFRYADKILVNWHNDGLATLEDVRAADRAHRTGPGANRREKNREAKATGFSNYRQRDNDYDDLQRQLLLQSMQ